MIKQKELEKCPSCGAPDGNGFVSNYLVCWRCGWVSPTHPDNKSGKARYVNTSPASLAGDWKVIG